MADLIAEHYPAIFRFCARRIGSDLAADASQETFVTAWKQIRAYEGRSNLSTWLFGIANNTCRNMARKRKMENEFAADWLDDKPADSPEPEIVARETLRSALSKLSSEHREVILLHEIEGFGYEEIAQLLSIPLGTVKSRIHTAFQLLRKSLNPETQP